MRQATRVFRLGVFYAHWNRRKTVRAHRLFCMFLFSFLFRISHSMNEHRIGANAWSETWLGHYINWLNMDRSVTRSDRSPCTRCVWIINRVSAGQMQICTLNDDHAQTERPTEVINPVVVTKPCFRCKICTLNWRVICSYAVMRSLFIHIHNQIQSQQRHSIWWWILDADNFSMKFFQVECIFWI